MNAFVFFAILGLGVGGLYSLMASGLIAAYRASGVINFAHGAIATYVAYAFTRLRDDGTLMLPWIDILPSHWLNIPTQLRLWSGPMPFGISILAAILLGTLLSLLAYLLVFRPLRDAAPLAKVIAAVGVLLYLQAVLLYHYGSQIRAADTVLPSDALRNFLGLDRALPQDRLWLAGIAVALAGALTVFYRLTRVGLVTRALADNETAGVLIGYSPVASAALSWAIAGGLAAVLGILAAPIAGSDPNAITLMLVPALSVVMIARFGSPLLAAGFALLFGSFESIISYLATFSWFPRGLQSGITQVIPLIVILVVLYVREDVIPKRGAMRERALPIVRRERRPAPVLLVLVALGLLGAARFTGPWAVALTTSVIGIVLMLSLVVLVGYIGQLSLAQLSIAAIAAFALMRLMSSGQVVDGSPVVVSGPGFPFFIAAPLSIAIGTVVGVLVGMPALRIRGVQLAIATIALALTIQEFVLRSETIVGEGAGLLSPVPRPSVFGFDLGARDTSTGLTDRFAFSALTILVAAVLVYAVARLRDSDVGRRMIAVRGNERAAAGVGVNVAGTKILAITLASAIASIGGVLLALQRGALDVSQFSFFAGLLVVAFVYIGGISSAWGAVLGGVIMTGGIADYFVRVHVPGYSAYGGVVGGFLLTLNVVLNPAGVVEGTRDSISRIRRRFGRTTTSTGSVASPPRLPLQSAATPTE